MHILIFELIYNVAVEIIVGRVYKSSNQQNPIYEIKKTNIKNELKSGRQEVCC